AVDCPIGAGISPRSVAPSPGLLAGRLVGWQRWIGVVVACIVLGAGYFVQGERNRRLARSDATAALSAARGEPRPDVAAAPAALQFELREASQQLGLVNTHETFVPHPSLAHIAPWISATAMGAAAAVADVDGDGFQDVYLPNSAVGSKNRLFH